LQNLDFLKESFIENEQQQTEENKNKFKYENWDEIDKKNTYFKGHRIEL
jgi:hypothetical protein